MQARGAAAPLNSPMQRWLPFTLFLLLGLLPGTAYA